jgi:hypothetical protein
MIDATRLAPKLWIGSAPRPGHHLREAGFDVLVLCAQEYQLPSSHFPGVRIIRCPYDDVPQLDSKTEGLVQRCARQVLGELLRGKRVLVTCAAGRNRSGLVAARVLMKLTGASAKVVVPHIQALREGALTNPVFTKSLGTYVASTVFV